MPVALPLVVSDVDREVLRSWVCSPSCPSGLVTRARIVLLASEGVPAPTVTLRPGQETRFTLHYTPNTSGGSGVTFTTLVVTPPNESHPHSMPLAINLAVDAGPDSTSQVYVDPVGAGK